MSENKLTILFRVEPGCLGPHGRDHINEFCEFAQKHFDAGQTALAKCEIISRNNKHLPETEYKFASRNLNENQANRYMERFGANLESHEEALHEQVTELIDLYAADHPELKG